MSVIEAQPYKCEVCEQDIQLGDHCVDVVMSNGREGYAHTACAMRGQRAGSLKAYTPDGEEHKL